MASQRSAHSFPAHSFPAQLTPPQSCPAHLSAVDCLLQQAHHVLPFAARGFETLRPLEENPLEGKNRVGVSRAGWEHPTAPQISGTHSGSCRHWAHLIQVGLLAWEGEGEAQRERHSLHPHVLQEVGDAVDYVVEELDVQSQGRRAQSPRVPCTAGSSASQQAALPPMGCCPPSLGCPRAP